MISCVTWVPSKTSKEWPDKVHEIPVKNLPIMVDDNMWTLGPEVLQQFLDDDDDDDNDDVDDASKDGKNKQQSTSEKDKARNPRKRKLTEVDDAAKNSESDKTTKSKKSKKSKTDKRSIADVDADDEDYEADASDNEQEEEEEEEEEPRFADIEDPDKFTAAVMEGYDDEPLDFISRIAGLHSGIGIGHVDYCYDTSKSSKKHSRWSDKRQRIISAENIVDTKNDSEIEDIHIKPTDELFICLGCDDDRESSTLQVHVFDTELRTFYEHHDVILAAFPLCCKWLQCPQIGSNLLAIGSVEESIELFNLDVMDALEPLCSLGGRVQTEKGEKLLAKWNEDLMFNYTEMSAQEKQQTLGSLKPGSHSQAVLALDWTAVDACQLLSASADTSVKVWDLNKLECARTLRYHTDKVQQIKIKPNTAGTIITGGFDKQMFLCDIHSGQKPGVRWSVSGEIETLAWHPANEHLFVATLDNGVVQCFDVRNEKECVWQLEAHAKAVTALSFHKVKPELFVTASLDKKVKLWVQEQSDQQPKLLTQQANGALGGVFAMDFAPKTYIPDILVVGGQQNFAVWDIMSDDKVRAFYRPADENLDKRLDADILVKHQHRIMEQTFNYKPNKRFVITGSDEDEDLDKDSDDDVPRDGEDALAFVDED